MPNFKMCKLGLMTKYGKKKFFFSQILSKNIKLMKLNVKITSIYFLQSIINLIFKCGSCFHDNIHKRKGFEPTFQWFLNII